MLNTNHICFNPGKINTIFLSILKKDYSLDLILTMTFQLICWGVSNFTTSRGLIWKAKFEMIFKIDFLPSVVQRFSNSFEYFSMSKRSSIDDKDRAIRYMLANNGTGGAAVNNDTQNHKWPFLLE